MKTLTTEQLRDMQDRNEDFELINVLPEDDFRAAHIPQSRNIPFNEDDFVESVERAIGNKNRKTVVYCASTSCDLSPNAAKKLEEGGFRNVYDFEGGVKAWQDAGLPVEGDKIHV